MKLKTTRCKFGLKMQNLSYREKKTEISKERHDWHIFASVNKGISLNLKFSSLFNRNFAGLAE